MKSSIGFITLSIRDIVDEERESKFRNSVNYFMEEKDVIEYAQVHFSSLEELVEALETVKLYKSKKLDFLISSAKIKELTQGKKITLVNVVTLSHLYSKFNKMLHPKTKSKYNDSIMKHTESTAIPFNNYHIENEHLDISDVTSKTKVDTNTNEVPSGEKKAYRLKKQKENILAVAKEFGLEIINIEEYKNMKSVLKWKCKNGHEFEKACICVSYRKTNPCEECECENKEKRKARECLSVMQKRVIDFAHNYNLIVDASQYKDIREPLEWTCSNGHRIELCYRSMKVRQHKCIECCKEEEGIV